MKQDYTLSRLDSQQFAAYANYYLPIAKKLKRNNLQSEELAKFKYQRYMTDYMNTVQSMDRNIGRLLNHLDTKAYKDNTLIIYLSDQGFYLGEHGWYDKRWMYEQSFRTPLIVRLPNKIKANSNTHQKILNLDIAATLLDYAEIIPAKDLESRSFRAILEGKKKKFEISYTIIIMKTPFIRYLLNLE